jgi:ribokinase
MNTAPRICVLGSLNMDLVVRTPRLPRPGETVPGGPLETFPGGKGANQAVAAARAGGRVAMIGAVGADEHGAALRAGLELAGVEPRLARRHGLATGVASITVDAAGENSIVVSAGANGSVDEALIDAEADAIAGADLLLVQLEVPAAAVLHAAQRARQHGVRLLLNAAPAAPLDPRLLAATAILVVNRLEAIAVGGTDPDLPPDALARHLAAAGPALVVVTLGAAGAVACDGRQLYRQPGFAVDAVDSVAAGDAFVGALAVELAAGTDVAAALRFACAAGALATTRRGAQPSLPTRAEIAAFLAVGRTGSAVD